MAHDLVRWAVCTSMLGGHAGRMQRMYLWPYEGHGLGRGSQQGETRVLSFFAREC